MAFLLCSTSTRPDGHREYTQSGGFSLAGLGGLIRKSCQRYLASQNVGWTITERELLSAGGYDESTSALVLDIAPKRAGEVNLYEIKEISGYTYRDWTPVMLTLKVLVDEYIAPGKEKEKKRHFKYDTKSPPEIVREFLYVKGGFEKGDWRFGRVGGVNGALLWGDAMEYFLSRIQLSP